MLKITAALSVAALAATLAVSAAAADALSTVSDYADAMNGVADRLDAQVLDRQKAGDVAAAQRLVLASHMTRRAADEFRGAEQVAMTDPVDGLDKPVPARLRDAWTLALSAEAHAADDPAFIAQAQKTYNALLQALPMKTPHPVIYGLLSRDLTTEPLPADVVIYGWRLLDPVYKEPPTVSQGGVAVTAALANDERIDVSLPDEVKKAVDFAPPPCESRPGFGLRVYSAYARAHGVWPVIWNERIVSTDEVYALPTPVFYTVKTTLRLQPAAASAKTTRSFEQRSQLVSAACEETRSADVVVTLPPGAKLTACSGAWVDVAAGAARSASRCVTQDGAARVTGEISGGARVCSPDKLCSCPFLAEGYLEAKGSYEIPSTESVAEATREDPPFTFPLGGRIAQTLDASGGALRSVELSFSRRACPREVDTLNLGVGDSGDASGVSRTGAFRAALGNGALSVGASDAFAADVGRAP